MIIKHLAEIKATVNTTNTLVTYNKNSKDKTIQITTKNFLKTKKTTNKNLANTKTLSTTDNFSSTCFEHPKNQKNANANGKDTSEANEKKKTEKRRKKIITVRLQIGTTTPRTDI